MRRLSSRSSPSLNGSAKKNATKKMAYSILHVNQRTKMAVKLRYPRVTNPSPHTTFKQGKERAECQRGQEGTEVASDPNKHNATPSERCSNCGLGSERAIHSAALLLTPVKRQRGGSKEAPRDSKKSHEGVMNHPTAHSTPSCRQRCEVEWSTNGRQKTPTKRQRKRATGNFGKSLKKRQNHSRPLLPSEKKQREGREGERDRRRGYEISLNSLTTKVVATNL